nr:pseudouridine synthase [Pseudoxanthomonas sp.]
MARPVHGARARPRTATGVSAGSSGLPPRHGVARVLSKLGVCSRSEATRWVQAGRVGVDGRIVGDPEFPVIQGRHRISVDGHPVGAGERLYLMLNKPRGLLTTASDEHDRDTVYRCFEGAGLPWLGPVGRLDKASEGLLLFTNDPGWAAAITDPGRGPDKTYHVQVNCIPDAPLLARLMQGVDSGGETLRAKSALLLRAGEKNAWLEIQLDEGRNRQIRRLLEAFDIQVLRLVRTAIGPLPLGDLAKGAWRALSADEVAALS